MYGISYPADTFVLLCRQHNQAFDFVLFWNDLHGNAGSSLRKSRYRGFSKAAITGKMGYQRIVIRCDPRDGCHSKPTGKTGNQLLTYLHRQGGREQDCASSQSGMKRKQCLEKLVHVGVVGMDFIDNQDMPDKPKESKRL